MNSSYAKLSSFDFLFLSQDAHPKVTRDEASSRLNPNSLVKTSDDANTHKDYRWRQMYIDTQNIETNIILTLPIRVSLTIFNPLCIIATSLISVNEQYLLFLWVMCTYMSPFICKQYSAGWRKMKWWMSFDKMTQTLFAASKWKNAVLHQFCC